MVYALLHKHIPYAMILAIEDRCGLPKDRSGLLHCVRGAAKGNTTAHAHKPASNPEQLRFPR